MFGVYEVYTWDDVNYTKVAEFELGLKEALKKNIDKGLLTCRWECLSFAVGYLEKTVGYMPFEVIEFINTLYMDDYIGR